MNSVLESIPLEKLTANPANPNRMSKSNFTKLTAHIERTGRYEPIVVRPHPQEQDKYEIINGHHRCEALRKLGRPNAQCIVWGVDEYEADLLLATLNRLSGRDDLHKRSELISKLAGRLDPDISGLLRLLPESKKQIERLKQLAMRTKSILQLTKPSKQLATAVVFFLTDEQKVLLDKALAKAAKNLSTDLPSARRKTEALMEIVKFFMTQTKQSEEQE
jgi:ParB family chromosome partitioning protein